MRADQLILEAEYRASSSVTSLVKTILVHVDKDEGLEERLDCALSLARATLAHVHCVQVTPIQSYVTMETWGGIFLTETLVKRINEQEENLRLKIEEKLKDEDVSWDLEQSTSYVLLELMRQAAFADLVISSRQFHSARKHRQTISGLGDLIERIRTPLLLPGDMDGFDPFGPAVIAWNGSYEAANAVRQSLGLLKLASRVRVVRVIEDKDQLFCDTDVLQYLSHHEIHADIVEQDGPGPDGNPEAIADTIVAHAHGIGAAYLVVGAYSHSRAREYVFGGVTRSLLGECPLALVIAH